MRLFWFPVAFLAALAAGQNATEELETALKLVASMPECAVRAVELNLWIIV